MKFKKGDSVNFKCPYEVKHGIIIEIDQINNKAIIQTSISKWTVKIVDIISKRE